MYSRFSFEAGRDRNSIHRCHT